MSGCNQKERKTEIKNKTAEGRVRVEREIRLNEREERVSKRARRGGREESNGIWEEEE